MPRDVAFILSKFDVNLCSHSQDPLDQKNADGRTDGFSALYSRFKAGKMPLILLPNRASIYSYFAINGNIFCYWGHAHV